MVPDEDGAHYAMIDEDSCVNCGLCVSVCAFRKDKRKSGTPESPEAGCASAKSPETGCAPAKGPEEVYAAAAKDPLLLEKASSGGVFSACAESVLTKGGIVYGCSMQRHEDRSEKTGKGLRAVHIRIDDVKDLGVLSGSKYVQSDTAGIFRKIRADLNQGRDVLFGGTPCQCAAVRQYLKTVRVKEDGAGRLILIDIVCHGVPGEVFFGDYVRMLEKKAQSPVTDIVFRDKRYGWGLKGTVTYGEKGTGEVLHKELSSYYHLFLKGAVYRESCYGCPYAGPERPGDLTACDYWGIESEHPDYLAEEGGPFDKRQGISALLVNTENGRDFLEMLKDDLILRPTSFERVSVHNGQLRHPTERPPERETVLSLYHRGGYGAVEEWYQKELGRKRWLIPLKESVPAPVRTMLKKLVRR